MPRISTLAAAVEIDVVKAAFVGGAGTGYAANEFFNAQIQHLKIQNQILANFEIGAGLDLHAGAAEVQAFRIDGATE